MESILLDTMFDLPSLEGVEEVVISKEVVEGTARPLYIYADRAGDAGRAPDPPRICYAFGCGHGLQPPARARCLTRPTAVSTYWQWGV